MSLKLNNEIIDVPVLRCGPDEIELKAHTLKPFEGQTFVRGHHRSPDCARVYDTTENITSDPQLSISLSRISSCGLTFERNSETRRVTLRAVIIFAFHPLFVTSADRSFSIECAFQQHDFTVQTQLDSIGDLSTIKVITATALPPKVHLSINGGVEKESRKDERISVGSPLLFKWSLDNSYPIYGFRVVSCDVETKDERRSSRMIEAGCSLDETLIANIRYSENDSVAFADGFAFKFADEEEVWMRCQVQLCIHKFEHLIVTGAGLNDLCQAPKCDQRLKRSNMEEYKLNEQPSMIVSERFIITDSKVLPAQEFRAPKDSDFYRDSNDENGNVRVMEVMGEGCRGCGYKANTEDHLAAIVIFLTAICGVVSNSLIALTASRLPLFRNSFGRLVRLQSTGEALFLAVWAFYFAPTLAFNLDFNKSFEISRRFGQLCLICYDISIYTHLIISINRFVSLYFPTHYGSIFTDDVTKRIIFAIILFSISYSWVLPAGNCNMEFSNEKWMLDYHSSCNLNLLFYAEFLRAVVIVAMIFLINSATFIRMYCHNRGKSFHRNSGTLEAALLRKRRNVEINFIRQVCLQGLAYLTELITYFFVSLAFPQKWPNFLLTTWAWLMVHTADGFITLLLNKQFRFIFFSSDESNQPQTITLISSNKGRYRRSTLIVMEHQNEEESPLKGESIEVPL
ncbi:unnamed protein product, partial [Mesorhabditis belari]|uniref:ZP domain-containing protein n=1 Tax=Mesorhabditis belari TaxID=2138241 RepID=A0AAF3JCE3_9BILA